MPPLLRWFLLLCTGLLACVTTLFHREYSSAPLELRRVPGFLSDDECEAIRRAALRKGLSRSVVVRTGTSTSRTSSTTFLAEADDPVVTTVFDKVTALLGATKDRFENLQVIRYERGEEYKAHYDPCFKCDGNDKDLPREHTVLIYLNDDFGGGSTDFPEAGVSVRPVKGMAAVFRSLQDGRIVRGSKHCGAPVTDGTKWAATVWVRPK